MTKQTADEFVKELRDNFNKHVDTFIAADDCLAKSDWDGFRKTYTSMPKEQLEEVAMAQHLKTNEIYQQTKMVGDSLEDILRDITYCKDFVAFEAIKIKAEAVMLAKNMMQQGMSADEIRKRVAEKTQGLGTSNIIVQ